MTLVPARRKRHIACDELFHFITKLIARSFCCSSLPNWTRCRWAPVWRRRFAAVHTFKRAEIISVGTAFLPGKVRFATTSFYACGKKRRHPLASLLLLSKPNPLRWASVWCRRFAAILFHHNKLLIFDLSSCSLQASYRLRRAFSFYYKAHRALILLLLTPKLDPLCSGRPKDSTCGCAQCTRLRNGTRYP